MGIFGKILVPLDGSPLAQAVLPYVMVVAKGFHSRVILVHVAETALDHQAPEQKTYAHETMERIRPLAEDYLAGVADEFREEGIDVETEVVKGRAAPQIAEYAEQENVDLIAMSTHGRSGLAHLAMGSHVDRILRACEQPMLLIRPRHVGADDEAAGRFSKIIVPLDGSKDAEAAIPVAEELAKVLELEVILVTVIGGETTLWFAPAPQESWPMPPFVIEWLQKEASVYLAGLAKRLRDSGLAGQWQVLRGLPGSTIVEFAKKTLDSLVVMTTHGHSGFPRWVMGSVVHEVVRKTGEPVLVIRP
jgi:nucleotide-binding universal stress UspA family protein